MLQILKSFDQTSIETRPSLLSGKWVVTPEYVVDSVRNGSWLPERSYEVAISTGSSAAFHPSRHWREKVATGRMTGAFQGWRVLLMVQEPGKRAMFKRWGDILEKKKKDFCVNTLEITVMKMLVIFLTQAVESRQSRSVQMSCPLLHLHYSCHGKACHG